MKRIAKGDFGYLKWQTKWEFVKTAVFFAAAIGVLLLGIHIAGTKNNLLTFVAVFGMLPASKELISFIMFIRASKYSCPETLYQEVENLQEEQGVLVVYDLYMTSQERNYPIYCMCCRNKTLIGVAEWEAFDYKDAENHISVMLRQNGYRNISVKIFDNREKYIARMGELAGLAPEAEETDQAVLHLMLNLSL
ncbi:MAG: hypothetical protein J6K26_04130 [Lachnospiraceae bacterium]|nr:hypothetical protein [Lachnospiraceae bacterium]